MSMQDVKNALSALQADGMKLGSSWNRAHELAQAHEGDPVYDRLHAFLHRVEHDSANAAYWYRRAGEPVFQGTLESECELLLERCTD